MNQELRVLIVEDSEDDTLLLLRELRKGGYEPVWERVETPEAMTATLAKGPWDMVVSDYVMPRFSGLAALDVLKQSGQDLPFIIVSGNIGEDIAVNAMKAGAHDYILKGNLTRLVPAVERELREAEVRRERRRAEEALQRYHEELEQKVRERTEELATSKRELERSNQELEQFAFVASHDLQEPLRMVTGFMHLLAQRYGGRLDDKAQQYITYAVDGAQRMNRLIRDLLMFSRVRGDTWEPAPVNMNEVFDQALANCGVLVAEANARITREQLPVVQGEAGLLTQLFQNLLVNAVKFRRPDILPEVHVAAARQDNLWLISVRDNGIGIATEQCERIFQIFQRLHTRQQYEGTGIGLAVCKRIVEFHGGRIRVESAPGCGSTFLFDLPAAASDDRGQTTVGGDQWTVGGGI
jgi:signal transduction histidine kinase